MAGPRRGAGVARKRTVSRSRRVQYPAESEESSDTDTSTAAEHTSKKQKKNAPLVVDQEIVTISVQHSNESREFKVPKYFLVSNSAKFREMLDENEENKVVKLHDTRPKDFEVLLKWMYTKELVVEEMESDNDEDSWLSEQSEDEKVQQDGNEASDEDAEAAVTVTNSGGKLWYAGVNRRGYVFARLQDLYLLASKYAAIRFKTAVMLQFQRFIDQTNNLPNPTIVRHAVDNLDMESPMRKYLIQCYGHYNLYRNGSFNSDRFATLSPQFLAAVLQIAFEQIEGDEDMDWLNNWCKFHEHESQEMRNECEESRPMDADMLRRNKIPLRRRGGVAVKS